MSLFHEPDVGQGPNDRTSRSMDAIERRFRVPHETVTRLVPSTTRTTASATYVDFANGTADVVQVVSFLKNRDDTKIVFEIAVGCYLQTAAGNVTFGVNFNSVDYDLAVRSVNETLSGKTFAAAREVGSIAKGTYTATLRWKTSAGTLTSDGGDSVCLTVRETF